MKPEVEIYDTTLRDGSQGEGINFSVADKLRIAEKLDAFGVQYIEGGWPGSNPKDIEFFAEAGRRTFKNARLAAFGSTRYKNVPVETDPQVPLLLEAETPVVTLVAKTWLLHVKEVFKTTPATSSKPQRLHWRRLSAASSSTRNCPLRSAPTTSPCAATATGTSD
jgi:2-isopropylmalate synthase